MHSHLLVVLWRRKLTIALTIAILSLFGLWSWAFYNTTYRTSETERTLSITGYESGTSHGFLLQKLISQANRVIKRQYSLSDTQPTHVRFIKPTIPRAPAKYKLAPEEYVFEGERLKMLQNQQRNQDEAMDEEMEETSAERQTQYEHNLQKMGVPVISGIGPNGPKAPKNRLVHLDLKGAPPKLVFLKQLLPILKTLGATGLLIEYEDMFPYSGSIEGIRAENAYREEDLADFLQSVALHGFQIIPLIQTFGHLEYALKLQGYEHLRESPESPQSICPSQTDTMQFLQEMISQIVNFHLRIVSGQDQSAATQAGEHSGRTTAGAPPKTSPFSYIHIGCDEVYEMAKCSKCVLRARNELFLTHVTTVAAYIKTKWSQLNVIIWDDMLRGMTLSDMKSSHIGSYVEPMIWVYANDIYRFIQPQLWDKYSRVFPTAWAASAFKGAFGESLMISPIQKHLENNLRWLAVIAKEGSRFSKGFQGIALTGWQRYNHFAVLCELLPTAMPSLITCLSTVSRGYFNVDVKNNTILNALDCPNRPDSRHSSHPWIQFQPGHHNHLFSVCSYPGNIVYVYMLELFEQLQEINEFLTRAHSQSAWMSDYNIRHNFSAPLNVVGIVQDAARYVRDLKHLAKKCHRTLEDFFDEHTIVEFIEQIIYPLVDQLGRLYDSGEKMLARKTWPRRPLPYDRNNTQLQILLQRDDSFV